MTCLLAGVLVFSILGYMAKLQVMSPKKEEKMLTYIYRVYLLAHFGLSGLNRKAIMVMHMHIGLHCDESSPQPYIKVYIPRQQLI